jgi:hypothetical protein
MSRINRRWHISSFSGDNGCVEVRQDGDVVTVRDSKDPDGSTLRFNPCEWRAFLAGVGNREFDVTDIVTDRI